MVDLIGFVSTVEFGVLKLNKPTASRTFDAGSDKAAIIANGSRVFAPSVSLPVEPFVTAVIGVIFKGDIANAVYASRKVVEILSVVLNDNVKAMVVAGLRKWHTFRPIGDRAFHLCTIARCLHAPEFNQVHGECHIDVPTKARIVIKNVAHGMSKREAGGTYLALSHTETSAARRVSIHVHGVIVAENTVANGVVHWCQEIDARHLIPVRVRRFGAI